MCGPAQRNEGGPDQQQQVAGGIEGVPGWKPAVTMDPSSARILCLGPLVINISQFY